MSVPNFKMIILFFTYVEMVSRDSSSAQIFSSLLLLLLLISYYRRFHIFHFFHLSRTFRGRSPFSFFLYKALPYCLVPQPFFFTLRLICSLSRTSTGYGPRLLSQPFSFVPTSDIVICCSHLTQLEPLHDRHSPFWPFFEHENFLGCREFFTHPRKSSKKSASSCIFVWFLPILSSFNTFYSFRPLLALAVSFVPVSLTAFRYSYRVRPRHRTYSPRSRSSVLVTHALANGVVRATRHTVVHLGCTHFPSFILIVLVFATSPRHSFSSFVLIVLILATSFALSYFAMHIFNLVSILAAISHVLADPPHGSEQSAKVVARETSLKLLSMGNKAFSDNEKVADECQSPPFMFLFRTSDRPEIVELRTENVNWTDIEEPKINEPGYHALVEENVKASVRRIVTNPSPSFVPPDSLVVRLECSVIHNNDEPLSLASSASITPPGQRRYRAHYSSLNLFSDIPRHLSPAPVWDIPPHGRQLILPPSTPAAAVVVSLAIGATASVGTTFGVERIERRFDVWRLQWVRAAAARRGGDEEDNPHAADADSVMLLDTDDHFQLGAKSRECHFIGYSPSQRRYRVRSNHFFTSGNNNLDTTPTLQPPHLDVEPSESHSLESSPAPRFCYLQVAPSTQQAVRTRSRDGSRMWKLMEKGQIFERKIEVEKARLEKIREAVARRGGEGDDNPFMALCNSGVLDAECTARTDSAVMTASLYADDYLQRHIDRLYEATTNVTNLAASQPPNFANILDLEGANNLFRS